MGLGRVHIPLGDFDTASDLADEAIAMARELHDPYLVADGLRLRASCAARRDKDDAFALSETALRAAEATGDLNRIGNALCAMGLVHYIQGPTELAVIELRNGCESLRRAGNRIAMSTALNNLGCAETECGDLDSAETHLSEAWSLAEQLGIEADAAYIRVSLALVRILQGQPTQAERLVFDALPILQRLGDKPVQSAATRMLALAASGAHADRRAAYLWGAADTYPESFCDPLEQELRQRDVRALRDRLGEENFTLLYQRGKETNSFDELAKAIQADLLPLDAPWP
jgi:tetratricopeptide (TPR) repeat protein